MYRTFGAPGVDRTGADHAGDDSPTVRPIRPGNALPGLYSVTLRAPSPHPHGKAINDSRPSKSGDPNAQQLWLCSQQRCRETTIDHIRTSGAEARAFRCQKHGEAGDVVESHIAALSLLDQRIEAGQSQGLFVDALLRAHQFRVGESWTDCVDANG